MGCIFRARVNHLWSVWYTVVVTLLHVYLLYLGFERYKLYTEMKWPHGGYPRMQLSAYIALHAACIPALLLFMAFGKTIYLLQISGFLLELNKKMRIQFVSLITASK